MTLKDLEGAHVLQGYEMTRIDYRTEYGELETRDALVFRLDGVNYALVNNPSDGYRSYCEELAVTDREPKYKVPNEQVLCHTEGTDHYWKNDDLILVIRNIKTAKIIMRIGTDRLDSYYPFSVFELHPENISCNERVVE